MSHAKRILRKAVATEAGRRLGLSIEFPRIWQSEINALQDAAPLLALPLDFIQFADLQNGAGQIYFQPDFHPPDSLDFPLQ